MPLIEIHPWSLRSQATYPITDESQTILPDYVTRRYLLVQNRDAKNSIFVAINRPATTEDLQIFPGGKWEPVFVPRESVHILTLTGKTASAYVLEGQ